MTPDTERARKWIESFLKQVEVYNAGPKGVERLAREFAAVRREALEEAAREAERALIGGRLPSETNTNAGDGETPTEIYGRGLDEAREMIVLAIRALASREEK